MDFTFKKEERLCGKKAIDVLFAQGKSKTQFPLKVMYKISVFDSPFPVRAMFVVPKKKHKRANKRNILKRRMRELYRLNKHNLYESLSGVQLDIMFIFLSSDEFEYKDIEKNMCSLLKTLSELDFFSAKKE